MSKFDRLFDTSYPLLVEELMYTFDQLGYGNLDFKKQGLTPYYWRTEIDVTNNPKLNSNIIKIWYHVSEKTFILEVSSGVNYKDYRDLRSVKDLITVLREFYEI